MNLTLYFILAHFIADYPLQTNWVARYKQDHVMGLLVHTFTHLVVTTLILYPFWHDPRIWWGILAMFVTHTAADQIKITHNKKGPRKKLFFYYMMDQFIHVSILLVISIYLGLTAPKGSYFWLDLYNDNTFFAYLLVLTLATYFYDITRWMYRCSYGKKTAYQRDYKMMIRNAVVVTVVFGVYWSLRG